MNTYNGDEVVGNNGQVVAIDAEPLNALRSSINQSQSVGFPSGELEFCESCTVSARSGVTSSYCGTIEVHLAIYQVVVRCWSWVAAARQRLHDFLHKLKVLGMIPVTKKDGTEIDIVVGI